MTPELPVTGSWIRAAIVEGPFEEDDLLEMGEGSLALLLGGGRAEAER